MTYQQLIDRLSRLSPEQLQMTATVEMSVADEAIAVEHIREIQQGDVMEGVLDEGHPVISVNF